MSLTKHRLSRTVILSLLLGATAFINGCSGGGPASIRYEFSSPEFSSEELKTLQSKVQNRINASYEKRDGNSAGSDWILWKKGAADEPANRIYFSETKGTDSYVIGISGKQSFRNFSAAIETDIKKLFPGREFTTDKTSKLKKSIQFLKSEL